MFEPEAKQEDILEHSGIKRLIDMALEGFSTTCFCYGQTGSGKTYTVTANTHESVRELFAQVPIGMTFYMSFYEIYDGKVRDLLNEKQVLQV